MNPNFGTIPEQAGLLGEESCRYVIDQISHKILLKNLKSEFISCNGSFANDFGLRPEHVAAKTDFDFFPVELARRYRADDRRVIESGERLELEEPYTVDGRTGWVSTSKSPMRSSSGEIVGVLVVLLDITDQKEARESLSRHNWALKALSDGNRALVYSESEARLIAAVCEAITAENCYQLAWIGWKEKDEEKSVSIVASAGCAGSYAEGLKISWGNNAFSRGPSGMAMRTDAIFMENDFERSEAFQPWREKAMAFGLRSSASLPIRINGEVAGVLSVYSRIPSAFTESATKLFQELVSNLSYGIESRRTKDAYHRALQEQISLANRAERALEDSLLAIAATLEQRDPYTAGHEKNVAELAVSIGRQMGWDERRLQGLYLAGIVHDLGKIHIPVEILTKPGRLTPAEYALIKTHPEVGYNILKNIQYPWPIAEMVRQHHEYLDGSGYPHGLKEGHILDEARILTVADIYESMSSPRPYRAALGRDSAIGEIRRLQGIRLDPAVVKAFLEVV